MNINIPYDAVIGLIVAATIVSLITIISVTIIKIVKTKNTQKCGCK